MLKYSSIEYSMLSKESTPTDRIIWNPSVKLKWEDFQGKVIENSKYKALTYSTVEVKPIKLNKDTIAYEMTCWFEKKMSWSKNKNSDNLLRHEQLHFDITELVTRKMRKKFLLLKPSDWKNARELVKKYFYEEEKERELINKKYDLETDHGTISSKQKEWEIKIAKELKELETYSSPNVIIVRR